MYLAKVPQMLLWSVSVMEFKVQTKLTCFEGDPLFLSYIWSAGMGSMIQKSHVTSALLLGGPGKHCQCVAWPPFGHAS